MTLSVADPASAGGTLKLETLAASASFPYRVEEKIGEGSMGVVYRAIEPTLGRPVAIKVLKVNLKAAGADDPASREIRLRFAQEARSAAAIQHPGAVTIYRAGTVAGQPFIAMEWLGGETLAAHLSRSGPMEISRVIDLAVQVLDTLQAAHDSKVIHRDIKPSNLVLLRDGRVKVTDFGIARFRGGDLLRTHAGLLLGTPGYAAPEQLRGEDVDARADLFSLGMVLYEALSGGPPFSGTSVIELASKILHETPRPIGTVRPDIPGELGRVLERALAKSRAERWSSARQMAEALRALLSPSAGSSSPSSWAGGPLLEPREATAVLPAAFASLTYRGLPAQLPLALVHLVTSWPAQNLPAQPIDRILRKLLERPIHAPAFSGGLLLGNCLLLLHDGYVLGAVDRRTAKVGEEVADVVGGSTSAQLHPLPEGLPARTLEVLAGLLGKSSVRQAALDSSILHLPGMADSLAREQFDGVLRLQRGDDEGRVVFVGGRNVMSFYSGAWEGADLDRSWTSWVSQVPLSIDVETVRAAPLELTWRVTLHELALRCERNGGTRGTRGSGGLAARRLPLLARRLERRAESLVLTPFEDLEGSAERWRQAPATRVLEWLLTEGSSHFAESKLAARWKYLAEWLPLVRRARLYSTIAPGSTRGVETFDVVTYDDSGKILHLMRRLPHATPDALRAAVESVIEAKSARLEGGDIGGVVFVASEFPEETIVRYLETIDSNARGLQKLQENVTGYAGFVRLGPRRGFHLMLVEDRAGVFVPLGF